MADPREVERADQALWPFSYDVRTKELRISADQQYEILSQERNRLMRALVHETAQSQTGVVYIKGHLRNTYAVSAGPTSSDQTLAWDLIWQSRSNRIVVLTDVTEENKEGFERHLAVGASRKYGQYTVSLRHVRELADYVIRQLHLSKGDQVSVVHHFQFTTWPAKGRPAYGAHTLLSFLKAIHALSSRTTGPLIIHGHSSDCRIGTFIVLDVLIQQEVVGRTNNTFDCVHGLLRQRPEMLPTQEQYVFLDEALSELDRLEETTYSCRILTLEHLEEIIPKFREDFKGFLGMKKNEIAIKEEKANLPGPCGIIHFTFGFTPVDSFRKHDYFVVTRMPTRDEREVFWSCVYDWRIKSIVMLNQLEPEWPTDEQIYWPEEDSISFRSLRVTFVSAKQIHPVTELRTFIVERLGEKRAGCRTWSEPLEVYHYKFLDWPNGSGCPGDISSFVVLVNNIRSWQLIYSRRQVLESYQMIIHSWNQDSRCGVFCAAANLLDNIDLNEEINLQLTLRIVSRTLPQCFCAFRDFSLLYQIAQYYYNTKS